MLSKARQRQLSRAGADNAPRNMSGSGMWLDPDKASCIASAYERVAMNQGRNTNPVYPENQIGANPSVDSDSSKSGREPWLCLVR